LYASALSREQLGLVQQRNRKLPLVLLLWGYWALTVSGGLPEHLAVVVVLVLPVHLLSLAFTMALAEEHQSLLEGAAVLAMGRTRLTLYSCFAATLAV
jgi:hypothetical protein